MIISLLWSHLPICACLRLLTAYVSAYMPTIFQMPNRPFWFYQIAGADGRRLPRVSTKTTSKRASRKMAEDAEAKERERARSGNAKGRIFARFVENAVRLADEGKLSVDRAEEMIRELRHFSGPNPVWLQPLLDECAGGWGHFPVAECFEFGDSPVAIVDPANGQGRTARREHSIGVAVSLHNE